MKIMPRIVALALAAMGALALGATGADAQTTRIVPAPQPFPSQGVPGQNMAPPAPRQNLAPAPPPTTRPGEGDAATRIQGSGRTRLPAPSSGQ